MLEFDAENHRYSLDGVNLLGVTSVLSLSGHVDTHWFDETSRWRGSAVHKLCEEDDKTGIDLQHVSVGLRGYVIAWRQYKADSGFVPELVEHQVVSVDHGYAGTLDRTGRRRNATFLTIADLKTSVSGAAANWVALQLVAYAHALKPKHAFERLAVGLRPDGRYNVKMFKREDFSRDLGRWFEALRIAKERNGNTYRRDRESSIDLERASEDPTGN